MTEGFKLNPALSVLWAFYGAGQILYECAIVVAVFLILRLLIIAVPALVDLRDAVVLGDDEEEGTEKA